MDQISQIKQKLDVVDVVGSYVALKKSGRNYKGLCPFHSEKTPSFMVSQELQMYKCFGCGAAGDIFNFVQTIEGVEFPTALEQLAERAGVTLEKTDYDPQNSLKKQIYFINELTAKFYQYILLKHKLGKPALEYLQKKRGLELATIKDFMLGYAPDGWDSLYKFLVKKGLNPTDLLQAGVVVSKQSGSGYIDKFRGRVVFPLTGTDGKIVGFTARTLFDREPKYLNTSETPVFHKTSFLFGLDKNKLSIKKEGAVFVEGQMDLISAYQRGVSNVVSVSGTSLTDNQLILLSRYTKDITFCFDADTAGVTASHRAIEMAERHNFNIKVALIQPPYKDLDEMLKSDTAGAKKALKNAIPAYDFYIVSALKKHDKNTAAGKKNIMDELIPLFSRISNVVMFEHYAKQLAKELDISEESVTSMLKKRGTEENYSEELDATQGEQRFKQNAEGYIIALLLKAPIEVAQDFTSKIKTEDFLNEDMAQVFEFLKEYLQDRKKALNINTVLKNLDEKLQKIVSELYLWDLESTLNSENAERAEKELEVTVKRIKSDATRRALKELGDQIKITETEKDTEKLEKLTKRFERLSKGLL